MEAYFLLSAAVISFGFLFFNQMGYNGLYPEKVIKRFRIKEGSWLKKLFFYKETQDDPYLYITVIPWLISCVILAGTLCLYVTFWIRPSLLSVFLSGVVSKIIAGIILGLSIAYTIVIHILRNMGGGYFSRSRKENRSNRDSGEDSKNENDEKL